MVETKDKISNIAIARLMDAIFEKKASRFILRLLNREELIKFLSLKFKDYERGSEKR